MRSDDWCVNIDADGTWPCAHVGVTGGPAPQTRLRLEHARVENPDAITQNRRHSLRCPDCGTEWRAWGPSALARPYVEWEPDASAHRYRRAKIRDIDRIIAAVQERFPELRVTQYRQYYPRDDDGVWWFGLPGAPGGLVQIESGNGSCPFAVETNDGEPNAWTVEKAAHIICGHLNSGRTNSRG